MVVVAFNPRAGDIDSVLVGGLLCPTKNKQDVGRYRPGKPSRKTLFRAIKKPIASVFQARIVQSFIVNTSVTIVWDLLTIWIAV